MLSPGLHELAFRADLLSCGRRGTAALHGKLWIVAEHGRHAAYVQNIEANPRVRVLVAGRRRSGSAHLVQDDDPRQRLS